MLGWRAFLCVSLTFLVSCSNNIGISDNPDSPAGPSCVAQMQPGETKAIDHSLTSLPARYYLTRGQDDQGHATYLAMIPVTFFVPGSCRTRPCQESPSPYAEKMAQKANFCLAQVAPRLTGPTGEKLTVGLSAPRAKGMGPFQIEISQGLRRGDSQHWDLNWECPAIVHEVMHLMGLVDENRETELVNGHSYDCRASGPDDSLMSNPANAYARLAAVPQSALLYPSQFNAIVATGCTDRNSLYYACAANSYLSSTFGNGCRQGLPAECTGAVWISGPASAPVGTPAISPLATFGDGGL